MIIVTGALGFIGSNLVKELNRQGYIDLVLVDDFDNRKMSNIDGAAYNKLISINDFYKNFKDWKHVERVFHEGAISSTTESSQLKINRYNIDPSNVLLDKCQEYNILLSYASSASVYGNGLKFTEESPLDPRSLYSMSKAGLDTHVENILKSNPETKIQGWRYFNVYGKNEAHKQDQSSPIFKFSKQAKETGKILIFEGSENYKRDFICVDDIVKIKIHAATQKINGIYNLGTGTAVSFKTVAEKIAKKYNAQIVEIPFPKELEGHYQIFTKADLTKLKASYGLPLTFTEIDAFLSAS